MDSIGLLAYQFSLWFSKFGATHAIAIAGWLVIFKLTAGFLEAWSQWIEDRRAGITKDKTLTAWSKVLKMLAECGAIFAIAGMLFPKG